MQRACHESALASFAGQKQSIPYHALELLLLDVLGSLAVDLTGAKGHRERGGHIRLDALRNVGVEVGRADPQLGVSVVLEFGRADLGQVGGGNKRQDDVLGVSLFDKGLDAERVGGVDKNASVLGSDDGFDDGSEVVELRQGLDAEQDVVEGALLQLTGLLRSTCDLGICQLLTLVASVALESLLRRGLKRSLPNLDDLWLRSARSRRQARASVSRT